MKSKTLSDCSDHVRVALLILVVFACGPGGGSQAAWAHDLDWPSHGNNLANTRFQNVDQITPKNVHKLQVAWVFNTGVLDEGASLQVSPIVINGVMYITDGNSDVFALNAKTGEEKWAYKPSEIPNEMPPFSELKTCCGRNNQGVAVSNGKVYLARLDGKLIALDAKNGKVVWKTEVVDFKKRFTLNVAPLVVQGMVVVGSAGGEYEVRGQIAAFNAETGKKIWGFRTTDPKSYDGDSWRRGGATIWQTPAADPDLGLLYFSTGNAAPDILGEDRAGDNRFATSIVALDLKTGSPRWTFQEVHHDIWDYDSAQSVVLFPLKKDGKKFKAIGHCSKNGQYYILDRRTGKPIYAVTEKKVPKGPDFQHAARTQPFSAVEALTPLRFNQLSPAEMPDTAVINKVFSAELAATGQKKVVLSEQYTPPDETLRLIMPGDDGGCEWNPAAFSPRTKLVYYGTRHEPHLFQTHSGNQGPNSSGLFLGSNFINRVPGSKPFGLYGATDTRTGKVVWKIRVPQPAKSGVLVAGNLVFFGEGNGRFRAANASTGKILFTFNAPAKVPRAGGAAASPIAYVAGGSEFIANAFGGNVPDRNNFQDGNCSSRVKSKCENPVGDAIIAFRLPK